MARGSAKKIARQQPHAAASTYAASPRSRDFIGLAFALFAVCCGLSLATRSSAPVAQYLAGAQVYLCGQWAWVIPLALGCCALSFFIDDAALARPRIGLGIVIIACSSLGLATLCNVPSSVVFAEQLLDTNLVTSLGGYIGCGIAAFLYMFCGSALGIAITTCLVIAGFVICGFSLSAHLTRWFHAIVEFLSVLSPWISSTSSTLAQKAAMSYSSRRSRAAAQQQADIMQPQAPTPAPARGLRRNTPSSEPKTTYLGSRKTTVLQRNDAAAEGMQAAALSTGMQPEAPTTKLRRTPHPDIDVGQTQPAGTMLNCTPQAKVDSSSDVSAFGTVQTTKEARDAAAAKSAHARVDAPAIPDFLLRAQGVRAGDASSQLDEDAHVPTSGSTGAGSAGSASSSHTARAQRTKTQAHPNAQPKTKAQVEIKPAPAMCTRPGDADDSYTLPSMSLLSSNPHSAQSASSDAELTKTMQRLQNTLQEFGLRSRVVDYVSGPLVTTFRVEMGEGERVNKIRNLEDDIALTLAAQKVRIFAPIAGTSFVGIEIPNQTRQNVHLGDVLAYATKGPLQVAVGRDSAGKPVVTDIAKMPHMLVAGTTGSGKSVLINSMIMSLLMRTTPKQVRLIMIDPKRVEFSAYNGLPHLYVPVVTEPRQAASALQWAVSEMERRLKLFERASARDIGVYNKHCVSAREDGDEDAPEPLPYLVVIIDELSDLMMVAGKDVEASIVRIAQLARAAGIHLVVATQRPSANVVTGLIKSNIDTRVALKVSAGIDSRVILDETGAERLLGNGDMLFKDRGLTPKRVLGCYTSDSEIHAVVDFIRSQGEPDYHTEILSQVVPGQVSSNAASSGEDDDDPLIWQAAQIVVDSQLGSTSGLQRRLKVGYARAGRIMDMLEAKGIVGPPDGSKPREVLMDNERLEEFKALQAQYRQV